MSLSQRVTSASNYLRGINRSGKVYRLIVELTNACNLRCLMCPRNEMTREASHMEEEMFEKIIAANHQNLEFVSLNGYGEPLLHPQIAECIAVCHRYKVPVGISTNATMLDEAMAEKILFSCPDVLILAIDSVQKDQYELIRVGARLDAVLENVDRFLRKVAAREKKPFMVAQSICMPQTRFSIRQFLRYFSRYKGVAVRIRQLTFSGRQMPDADYRNRSRPCYWLWTEPMVLSNGIVVPCCQDVNGQLALGHIDKSSLGALWQDGYITELRQKHAAGMRATIPLCKKCNMYQPGPLSAAAASIFHTNSINKIIPFAETTISSLRYQV